MTSSARKPDLFIIGAPKSGTTSLYDYLAGHPEVYMCPVKEPLYFCPDVRSGRGTRLEYPHDEAAYLALFDDVRGEKRLGEATTRYLVSHQAAALVNQFQRDAYAIAMLRNPVDMLYALHNERVSQRHERITSFEDALAADEDRSHGRRLPPGTNVLGGVYRESARYAEGLERWFSALGRERVHVIVFDDFARDTATEFRRVLEFLGVDPDYQPETFEAHNSSHRQRLWVRRIVDSGPGNWLTHDVLGRVLGTNGRARLALRFRQSRLNRRPAPRSPLAPLLRERLATELRPEVERLSAVLGRDLVGPWLERTST
jgi:hypothetical protein